MATGYKAQIIKGTTKVTYIILRAFGSISIKNYELKLVLEDPNKPANKPTNYLL